MLWEYPDLTIRLTPNKHRDAINNGGPLIGEPIGAVPIAGWQIACVGRDFIREAARPDRQTRWPLKNILSPLLDTSALA